MEPVPFYVVFDACVCFSCDSGGDCECLCTAVAAYAEECNRRGVYIRWRSQELCRMLPHAAYYVNLFGVFNSLFCFYGSLQLCSVRMGWCTIPVVQLVLPPVPVSSRVHTPSAAFSLVWKAASALLAKFDTVRMIKAQILCCGGYIF